MSRYYPTLAPIARITIYDVAPRILGAFDAGLVDYATANFRRRGITIKNSHHVTRVNSSTIEIKEEGAVPYGMLVWSTGLAPNPLIQEIGKDLAHDDRTESIKVNGHFNPYQAKDGSVMEDVFVIGDASVLEEPLPATAQGEGSRTSIAVGPH
jgi:NADH dehydrogenase